MPIEKEINNGERTHHHDQAITSVSLRTMKTIVNNPVKPIPLLDELLLLDIIPP
jgi:hypothetical protein